MLRIFFIVLTITLFTLTSLAIASQRGTEIVTLGNRSPSITGPATHIPNNPGENGALYGVANAEPSGGAFAEPIEKTQANRNSKGKTFSWRRPASRKISSDLPLQPQQ